MSRSKFISASLALNLLLAVASTFAHSAELLGSSARGKEKTRMCVGCHGIEGWRTAFPRVYSAPRLGGQHALYLRKALEAYKNGERSHPSMRAIAGSLSEQDIADLAAYYADQRP